MQHRNNQNCLNMTELFLTVRGYKTLNEITDHLTSLKSTWSDGNTHDWYYFSRPCTDVKLVDGIGFSNVLNQMIKLFICPQTGKKIVIISGASNLFWASQAARNECQEMIDQIHDFGTS